MKKFFDTMAERRRLSLFVFIIVSVFVSGSSINRYFPEENFRTAIRMDGYGYYAYLPYVFESDCNSFDAYLYYCGENSEKPFFIRGEKGKEVNKYYAGEALMIAPFYLVARFFDTGQDEKRAGYSEPLILSIVVAAFFYFILGLAFMRRILILLGYNDWIVVVCLITITFGTNLYWYTTDEPSMSHVYSFLLMNAFVYLLLKVRTNITVARKILLYFLLGLIALVRPTNVLIVLFAPYFLDWKTIRTLVMSVAYWPFFLLPVFVQLWLYYMQCDHWIVWGYADEFFDFANPHILDSCIGWKKGLLVYFPALILSLLGLLYLLVTNIRKGLQLFVPLLIVFYILSSWHAWHYGWNFGVRVYVEFYIFLFIPFAELLKYAAGAIWKGAIVSLVIVYGLVHTRSATRMARVDYPFIQEIDSQHWRKLLFKSRDDMKIEIEKFKKDERR